jgi:hypothetical protein
MDAGDVEAGQRWRPPRQEIRHDPSRHCKLVIANTFRMIFQE